MVITDDGRKYHEPTREWRLLQEDEARGYVNADTAYLTVYPTRILDEEKEANDGEN